MFVLIDWYIVSLDILVIVECFMIEGVKIIRKNHKMDQKLYCEIHDTIRSQYSCIRNECKNRTICIECH